MSPDGFFVGWRAGSARPVAGFLALVAVLVLAGLGGMALALGVSVNDGGNGQLAYDATVEGVLLTEPYPYVVTDTGHGVLLSGGGKVGVQREAAALVGQRVRINGLAVKRGTLDMMLVGGMARIDGAATAPKPEPLGTWRLTGEICDGKCQPGIMRPGSGISHRACATVCVIGGVPPVLVTTAPVAGQGFLLMADANGRALGDDVRDRMAIMQRMDGLVERVGDLLIFRTDLAKARDP